MVYKSLIILFLSSLCFNSIKAQELCDSTYAICDSITIDSIIFTDFPETGNRIHFYITFNHEFLHGPILFICTADDNTEFVRNDFLFSGIAGPITVTTYFEFVNFNMLGDILEGHLIVDNSNNPFPDCVLLFKTPVFNDVTSTNDILDHNGIEIYPNPTNNYLTIDLNNNNLSGIGVQLFDLMGRKQKVDYAAPYLDLNLITPGLYFLHLELNESTIVTKKIIVR